MVLDVGPHMSKHLPALTKSLFLLAECKVAISALLNLFCSLRICSGYVPNVHSRSLKR